jgi:Phosphoesterase family
VLSRRPARLDPATDGRPDPRPTVREAVATLSDLYNDFATPGQSSITNVVTTTESASGVVQTVNSFQDTFASHTCSGQARAKKAPTPRYSPITTAPAPVRRRQRNRAANGGFRVTDATNTTLRCATHSYIFNIVIGSDWKYLMKRTSWMPLLLVMTFPLAANATQAQPGIENIQNVIIIVQENRSFDSYFGTYPGANGIPMLRARKEFTESGRSRCSSHLSAFGRVSQALDS